MSTRRALEVDSGIWALEGQSNTWALKALYLAFSFMSYTIGNGATFRYLTENSPISGKRKRKLLLEIEKQESKKLKIFQKLI